MKRNLRIQQSALMLALATAYPVLSYGAAGTAQFANGEVTVKRGTAAPAPLTKGMTLESGDSISTGARGVAQIRFTDGGFVGVQPNSQFDITRYADRGNAAEDGFLVNLARGGMRAITGLIGKRNTANYKVTTSTATVGIRGSSFHLAYNPDGTLSVATEQDAIEVCTAAGCIGLTAGESAIVPSNAVLPTRTNQRTSMPLAPFRRDPVVAGDQTKADGSSSIVDTPVQVIEDGPQIVAGIRYAWSRPQSGGQFLADSASGAVVVDGGQPTQFTDTDNMTATPAPGATTTVDYTTGTPGSSDYMVLGSWSSAIVPGQYGGTSETTSPFAFVAGVPTSSSTIASLSGVSATYNLTKGTPVFIAGGTTGTLTGGYIDVNFDGVGSNGTIGMDMELPSGGSTGTYNFLGGIAGSGATFAGSMSANGFYTGTAQVQGFFTGNSAQHAGISYAGSYANSYGEGVYTSFGGAAVFAQTSSETLLGGYVLSGARRSGGSFTELYEPNVQLAVDGGDPAMIRRIITSGEGSYIGMLAPGETYTVHDQVTLGDGSKAVLATWSGSNWTGGEGTYYAPFTFVIGKPTADIGALGQVTGTYALRPNGATPVYQADGNTGTLNTANLVANFGAGIVSLNMGLSVSYAGSSRSVTLSSGSLSYNASNANFWGSVNGGSDYASVDGFFYGPNAQYAGFGYAGSASFGEGTYQDFGGAALLERGPLSTNTAPTPGTYSNLTATSDWSGLSGFPAALASSAVFNSSGLSGANSSSGHSFYGGTSAQFGHAGSDGTGDFIGWGTWSNVSAQYNSSSTSATNVAYVVGMPTPASYFAGAGTATYSVTGNTTPVSSSVPGAVGALSSASLTANFTASTVTGNVSTSFNGSDVVSGSVSNMTIQNNATFSGTGSGVAMSGLFTGPTAGRAGLTYSLTDSTYGTVTGAVGLIKGAPSF